MNDLRPAASSSARAERAALLSERFVALADTLVAD